MTDFIKKGDDPNTAWEKAKGQYGRVADAAKIIDPRHEQKRVQESQHACMIDERRVSLACQCEQKEGEKVKWHYLNHMKEEFHRLTLY